MGNDIEILEKQQKIVSKGPAIYYLIKDNEIVYVGQSINVMGRIGNHSSIKGSQYDRKKDFDSFSYIHCSKEDLNVLEAENIIKYNPKHNKIVPKNEKFKSISQLAEIYKITKRTVKVIIVEQEVKAKPVYISNYVELKEFDKAYHKYMRDK